MLNNFTNKNKIKDNDFSYFINEFNPRKFMFDKNLIDVFYKRLFIY